MKNNAREALLRDFEQHFATWRILDDVPWENPERVVQGTFQQLWQVVELNVRFDLTFVPKKDLDHPAARVEDYEPVFKVTGSKLLPKAAQPAAEGEGQ